MIRENYSNFNFFQVIPPGSKTAAVTGASVDIQGYQACTFLVHVDDFSQTSTTSAWFMRMQHGDSDADGSIGWGTVANSQMLFDNTMKGQLSGVTGFSQTVSTGSADGIPIHFGISNGSDSDLFSTVFLAGYIGNKRWVRLNLSQSTAGDVSAIVLAVEAMRGLPGDWPVNSVNR